MTPLLLDINDCQLQLWRDGERVLRSPGYALLQGDTYRFGADARDQARRHPRAVSTRFWWQLSTEALQPPLGPARHSADLVHAHLLDIHREGGAPEELLFTVPGTLSQQQLALLLGIVGHCPFNAVGLINRSVALASRFAQGEQRFHLELQLHQAVLSQVQRKGSDVVLDHVVPLPGCGLLQLQEQLVAKLAAAFVEQTRYDPRNKADTEQALYDRLPDLLLQLQEKPEANLELNGYRARVAGADLAATAQGLVQRLASALPNESCELLLDPLFGLLPTLHDALPQANLLPVDALPQALDTASLAQRDGQALHLHNSLPWSAEVSAGAQSEPAPVPEAINAEPAPSHLLVGDTAYALGNGLDASGAPSSELASLHSENNAWQLADPQAGFPRFADGSAEPRALRCGDELEFSNAVRGRLIRVH